MMILFRNRWFALIWGLLILGSAYSVATHDFKAEAEPAPVASEDPREKFARWAAEDQPVDATEDPESAGQKRYEVRIYDHGRDVTSQVSDMPDAYGVPQGEGQPSPQ